MRMVNLTGRSRVGFFRHGVWSGILVFLGCAFAVYNSRMIRAASGSKLPVWHLRDLGGWKEVE